MKILVLSSSLFTDRILLFSSIGKVYPNADFTIWLTSDSETIKSANNLDYTVAPFPEIKPLPERLNFLRKINDLAWSYKLNATSIISMRKFGSKFRPKSFYYSVICFLGKLVYVLRLCSWMEKTIFKMALRMASSEYVKNNLLNSGYDAIVSTNPFWETEREVALEAKKLGLPVIAFIPSWDNITTKSRLVFEPNAFIVWSDIRIKELNKYYPQSLNKKVFAVGAPQYDIFTNTGYYQSRDLFFAQYNLNPDKPTILYALGSPNFLSSEYEGVICFTDLFKDRGLHLKYNLIIRPHPNKDTNSLQSSINETESIVIQKTRLARRATNKRTQNEDDIINWVNTFRHSDVVINLSSTVIFDGLFFNKEIIDINFDPGTKGIYQEFIKEINSEWTHLKPLFNHPALYYANTFEDIFYQLDSILEKGKHTSEKDKKALFEEVCGAKDGLKGERLGKAIVNSIRGFK
jgi:hypothetical protein